LRSDPLHFGALTGVEASARMAGPVSRVAGACLVGAAISFWLAWWLMPLPGTTDTAFILEQVGATRARVFASVAVQVVSGALLVPGLLGLTAATPLRGSTAAFAAASLVGIGATGLAADAIYHLLAFEMTAPGVIREAMVPVMDRFQSADLVFVAPQLLALLTGVAVRAGAACGPGAARAALDRAGPRGRAPGGGRGARGRAAAAGGGHDGAGRLLARARRARRESLAR
jgi:hypothetical protein